MADYERIGNELLRQLGVDPREVVSFSIHFFPGQPPQLEVNYMLADEGKLRAVIAKYRLAALEADGG